MVCGELKRRGRLRFALEPAEHDFALRRSLLAPSTSGRIELDRGAARQQAVLGPPHFAHPAAAEQLDQLVAAHLLRLAQPAAQRAAARGTAASRRRRRRSWAEQHERVHDRRDRQAAQVRDPDAERIHRRGDERRREHLPRRRRHDHRRDQDDDRVPRQTRPSCSTVGAVTQVLSSAMSDRVQHHEPETGVGLRLTGVRGVPHVAGTRRPRATIASTSITIARPGTTVADRARA